MQKGQNESRVLFVILVPNQKGLEPPHSPRSSPSISKINLNSNSDFCLFLQEWRMPSSVQGPPYPAGSRTARRRTVWQAVGYQDQRRTWGRWQGGEPLGHSLESSLQIIDYKTIPPVWSPVWIYEDGLMISSIFRQEETWDGWSLMSPGGTLVIMFEWNMSCRCFIAQPMLK